MKSFKNYLQKAKGSRQTLAAKAIKADKAGDTTSAEKYTDKWNDRQYYMNKARKRLNLKPRNSADIT